MAARSPHLRVWEEKAAAQASLGGLPRSGRQERTVRTGTAALSCPPSPQRPTRPSWERRVACLSRIYISTDVSHVCFLLLFSHTR